MTGAGLVAAMLMVSLMGAAEAPAPSITGSIEVDQRIQQQAEERGYELRPLAGRDLVEADGFYLDPEAAAAWEKLQAAAREAGHSLRLIAGFRSHDHQRRLFLGRLGGYSASAIERCLRWTAPPGYSKHHTGRAIDITVAGLRAGRFGGSAAYAWMAADGYANARRHGFAPSYPPEGGPYGPNPEAWEWIYIGFDGVEGPPSGPWLLPL